MKNAVKFTEQRIEAFPTRVFRRSYDGLEGFNRRMRRIILKRESESGGGIIRSNVGSWHSPNDLLHWNQPEIKVFISLVESTLMDYVAEETERAPGSFDMSFALEAWANVSRRGHYSKPHVHPMSNFAIVYYVDVGDHEPVNRDDQSGCLEFLDPRNRAAIATPGIETRDSLRMRPDNSTMVVFPSSMYHYVHPYQGTAPRMSIACNATIQQMNDRAPCKSPERTAFRKLERD